MGSSFLCTVPNSGTMGPAQMGFLGGKERKGKQAEASELRPLPLALAAQLPLPQVGGQHPLRSRLSGGVNVLPQWSLHKEGFSHPPTPAEEVS